MQVNSKKKYCVFLDLDGTLLPKPSVEIRFFNYLWKQGLISYRALRYWFYFILKYGWRLRSTLLIENKAYLCQMEFAQIKAAGKKFIETEIIPAMHNDLLIEIKQLQADNVPIVLLTGANLFLAEIISEYFEFNKVIATKLPIKDNYFIFGRPLELPYGNRKKQLAELYCREHGYPLNQCIAYADSFHDRFLLLAVRKSIVVNPSARVKKMAIQNGWVIWELHARGEK